MGQIKMSNTIVKVIRKLKIFLFFIDSELSEYKKNEVNLREGFNEYNIKMMKKSFYRIKTFIYHKYHFLGNIFGLKCNGCHHLTKYHEELDFAKWKCTECPENNNICMMYDDE